MSNQAKCSYCDNWAMMRIGFADFIRCLCIDHSESFIDYIKKFDIKNVPALTKEYDQFYKDINLDNFIFNEQDHSYVNAVMDGPTIHNTEEKS